MALSLDDVVGRPKKAETTLDYFGFGESGQWHEKLIERNKATIIAFSLCVMPFPILGNTIPKLLVLVCGIRISGLALAKSYVEQYCMSKGDYMTCYFKYVYQACYLGCFIGLYAYNHCRYSRELVCKYFI